MTTRVLAFGGSGQLAGELSRLPVSADLEVVVRGRPAADIIDRNAVDRAIGEVQPAVLVNAAAYTAVDRAEDEPEAAFAVNETGPHNLAQAATATGIPLVQVSTDYVFDGSKVGAYGEVDPVAPLGVYGRSKEAGERAVRAACPAHIILRTAWVYSPFGKNFVRTMLNVGRNHDRLSVVDDQVGNPTSAGDIAQAILAIAVKLRQDDKDYGTYHFAGHGATSWCGFAREIFRQANAMTGRPSPEVVAIPSSQWPTKASRPANSQLDCTRIRETFGIHPPGWPESLNTVLRDLLTSELPGVRGQP